MNADEPNMNELQRDLERATRNASARDESLDPQAAPLREAWGLLGQLLQAAEAESPSRVAWDKLTPPPPAPARKHTAWKAAAALVVAASLLLGIVLARSWWQTPAGDSMAQNAAPTHKTEVSVQPQESPVKPTVAATTSTVDLAWDEPIDTEIAQARQQLLAVEQEWCFLSNVTYPVYGRLQEIQQEMTDGSM